MADKSMVEYSDYAMESTGLTGMISSGLPEIAGEKTKMKKRKPKERIYVCHTYYHVYVACLKELTLPRAMRGKADLVLTPSEYSRKLLTGYGLKVPVAAVSNGIDIDFFQKEEGQRRRFRQKYRCNGVWQDL